VKHDFLFRSNDCSSKLISLVFDSKSSCAPTKSEAICVNVLAPKAEEEIRKELNDASFI
jgi:hypothetical protein